MSIQFQIDGVFLSATLLGFGFWVALLVWFGAGICDSPLRWHPRIVSVLQASPLCGAAPTFLCRRKEK
jgi:hypothetical protein